MKLERNETIREALERLERVPDEDVAAIFVLVVWEDGEDLAAKECAAFVTHEAAEYAAELSREAAHKMEAAVAKDLGDQLFFN